MKKDYIIIGLSGFLLVLLVLLVTTKMPSQSDSIHLASAFDPGPSHWPEVSVPSSMEFCGEPVPLDETEVFERMDRELQTNTFYHTHTILVMKNAAKYFPRIEEILKEEGIPDDFKYLAVAESGLRNVVSPSNAVGFWQFLEETGKEYGLEINNEVDERYHWEKSTYAACRYFKKSYEKFGNWTTVAASYNMGMGGVRGAQDVQKVESYYDLKLTWEPTRYVFRIIALKEILSHPDKYRFKLSKNSLYQLDEVKYVTVAENIPDWISFAISHNISYKTLLYYNPWIRTKSLTVKGKEKTYDVAIPTESRNRLR